jgi:hypothetical protein
MAANIAALLEKAAAAPDKRRTNWLEFVPVVEALAQKNYSVWHATSWLVAEGQIPEESKRSAYHSLLQHITRNKK